MSSQHTQRHQAIPCPDHEGVAVDHGRSLRMPRRDVHLRKLSKGRVLKGGTDHPVKPLERPQKGSFKAQMSCSRPWKVPENAPQGGALGKPPAGKGSERGRGFDPIRPPEECPAGRCIWKAPNPPVA